MRGHGKCADEYMRKSEGEEPAGGDEGVGKMVVGSF